MANGCKECFGELTWVDCWNGCDDGYFDGYEDDPLWYDEGDVIRCDVCRGRGGWRICEVCVAKSEKVEA